MGEVVPARTPPTLHPPSPPTVHQLSRLALQELNDLTGQFTCGLKSDLVICGYEKRECGHILQWLAFLTPAVIKQCTTQSCKGGELCGCWWREGWLWFNALTLKVLVVTIDAQWEGMGDVGSARYELALLPPCPTIRVLSCSN